MILLFVKRWSLAFNYSTKKAPEGNSSLQALFLGYELKMIVRSLMLPTLKFAAINYKHIFI